MTTCVHAGVCVCYIQRHLACTLKLQPATSSKCAWIIRWDSESDSPPTATNSSNFFHPTKWSQINSYTQRDWDLLSSCSGPQIFETIVVDQNPVVGCYGFHLAWINVLWLASWVKFHTRLPNPVFSGLVLGWSLIRVCSFLGVVRKDFNTSGE
jgi:hypothetical protein